MPEPPGDNASTRHRRSPSGSKHSLLCGQLEGILAQTLAPHTWHAQPCQQVGYADQELKFPACEVVRDAGASPEVQPLLLTGASSTCCPTVGCDTTCPQLGHSMVVCFFDAPPFQGGNRRNPGLQVFVAARTTLPPTHDGFNPSGEPVHKAGHLAPNVRAEGLHDLLEVGTIPDLGENARVEHLPNGPGDGGGGGHHKCGEVRPAANQRSGAASPSPATLQLIRALAGASAL